VLPPEADVWSAVSESAKTTGRKLQIWKGTGIVMAKKEYVDWNEFRTLANKLRSVGRVREAELVRGLIRVAVSVDRGEFTEAAARLTELPQKNLLASAG